MRAPFDKSQLNLGEPLRCDLYNSTGNRIFRKGFVFRNLESLQRLQGMELYEDITDISTATGNPPESIKVPSSRYRKVMYAFAADKHEREQQIDDNVFYFLDYCVNCERSICERILGGATDQSGRSHN